MLTLASISHSGIVYAQTNISQNSNSEMLTNIQVQLEKQAAAMATIHLEYSETQTGEDVPSYYGGTTTYSTYFDANRFYLRTIYLYNNRSGKHTIHEDAFDGTFFYYGDPERDFGPPGILTKYLPSDITDPERSQSIYFRYFEAAGFYPPQSIADLNASSYIQSLVLHYIKESDSTTIEKKGENLYVTVYVPDPLIVRAQATDLEKQRETLRPLRNGTNWINKEIETLKEMKTLIPRRTVKFVLDSKHGYGVVERDDFTASGQKIVHVQSDKWKYYETADVWLPNRCIESYYTGRFAYTEFSDQPRLTVMFELNHVDFGPQTNAQFALNYDKPRSLIVDRTTPEAQENPDHKVTYTVAANGTLLRGVALNVLPEMNRARHWFWICVFLVLLGLPLIVFLIQHWRNLGKPK
jgi:hypothetical protein